MMEEAIRIVVGILFILLGIPVGKFLKKLTPEEMKDGQKYFKSIILVSLIVGTIGLILREDSLMFSCFFIAMVTSQSLKR